ncbi:DUF2076 domain-containing protein [Acidisoma sp.]|uniref:DUF2076 domain-containing protein n=1 Tax=Acidisoma sp. TaxID=1872115 RepID=UPI003B00C26F
MTPEERDIISRFVQRVAGSPAAGSVPATTTAPRPPVDPEADQHLATLFQQYPEARYRITQLAFGQEQALQGAAQHIQALEQQLAAAHQAQGQPGGQPGQPSGFFSRLFGGNQQGQPQPGQAPYSQPYQQQPGPGYAQQQPGFGAAPAGYGQQGMMAQRGGSGFLGSALTTAAGVAGGMLAFNAIEGLFTDRGAQSIGAGTFGTDQVGGGLDQSGWNNMPADQGVPDQGMADNSGWQTVPDQGAGGGADNSGWQDTSAPDDNSGGGWDDSGGGNSDWS